MDDLAEAAGVSVSTVDRVLTGRAKVRPKTAERVLAAAEAIGFYAAPILRERLETVQPVHRLGVLLQQSSRTFYRMLAEALSEAAAGDPGLGLDIAHMDDLSPEAVAARMMEMGSNVQALAVVSAEHPRITEAIEKLASKGVRTVALISALTAPSGVAYVGLDAWKVGRTAGWACARLARTPGRLGILVGNHRYRCQELNESGFRSYLREHAPSFTVLEPLTTFEDRVVAREQTERLLAAEPDLAGLYVAGGGITGALAAVRDAARESLVVVGYERMPTTTTGLLDGTLDFVIAHPLQRLATECLEALLQCAQDPNYRPNDRVVPFELVTSESL
ncbi:LacI family DNA-binding transcriptional regulator [Rubellimicrobium rubrum]|uniref:LacI family DNA-binding transcriptional regulator n=1 Tax=Rubellimicrobium rubrum TaxID=2585369 RepID=UPI002482D6DE|nr:LacI family DNA-binding transcriptional regulator [Rubellimicrobium rubrum]